VWNGLLAFPLTESELVFASGHEAAKQHCHRSMQTNQTINTTLIRKALLLSSDASKIQYTVKNNPVKIGKLLAAVVASIIP